MERRCATRGIGNKCSGGGGGGDGGDRRAVSATTCDDREQCKCRGQSYTSAGPREQQTEKYTKPGHGRRQEPRARNCRDGTILACSRQGNHGTSAPVYRGGVQCKLYSRPAH